MFIATQILISFFATTGAGYTTMPDACDQIASRGDKPRLCEPHQDGAPTWGGDVCCDQKNCFVPSDSGCEADEERYRCDLGRQIGRGVVQCYYEVPNFCDLYSCEPPGSGPSYQMPLQEEFLCCQYGTCYPYTLGEGGCPYGEILYCTSAYTNENGTVGCADDE